jgi:hypothetical protein
LKMMADPTESPGNPKADEARTISEANSEIGGDEKDPLKRNQQTMGEKGLRLVPITVDLTHTYEPILGKFNTLPVRIMIHLANVAYLYSILYRIYPIWSNTTLLLALR